jgi:hypothetical protein
MKRGITALVIGGIIFGSIYALAASIGVSSATLGAGNSVVAACQTGTVAVSYTPTYSSSATAGYRATTVTLGNLDTAAAACGEKAVSVTLTGPGASNAAIATATDTTPSTGTSMNITVSGVSASDVTGVHVSITG